MVITYSHPGSQQANRNADAFVTEDLTDRHLLMAVIDADSVGEDGHFSAALVAKALRKIARQINLRAFAERRQPTSNELLRETLATLFTDLLRLRADLDLGPTGLNASLVLAIVDRQGPRAEILAVGRGLVACDGETAEFGATDHLGDQLSEPFADWFDRQAQRAVCEDFLDLIIATDGIVSFHPFSYDPYQPVKEEELLQFLSTAHDEGVPETLYRRKIGYVRSKFGLEAADDLTIVRYSGD